MTSSLKGSYLPERSFFFSGLLTDMVLLDVHKAQPLSQNLTGTKSDHDTKLAVVKSRT